MHVTTSDGKAARLVFCHPGFFSGAGKGLVGALANPISGGLDALSTTFEGFDAASSSLLGRARPQAAVRSRLPRAIGGDHKLLPFKRAPASDERQASLYWICSSTNTPCNFLPAK